LNSGVDPKARLVDGNALYRKNVDPLVLAKLAKKQEPFVAILACSDSRVHPSKIFNLSIGDAFTVRVAGNSAADPSIMGSLEYAVVHLNVRAILVLGHTGCGAVKASYDEEAMSGSLSSVMMDMDRAKAKLDGKRAKDPDAVAEMNVKLQLRRLEDFSTVIQEAVNEGKLALFGAMYDLATGAVRFI